MEGTSREGCKKCPVRRIEDRTYVESEPVIRVCPGERNCDVVCSRIDCRRQNDERGPGGDGQEEDKQIFHRSSVLSPVMERTIDRAKQKSMTVNPNVKPWKKSSEYVLFEMTD